MNVCVNVAYTIMHCFNPVLLAQEKARLEPSCETNAPEWLLCVRESITLPSDMETQHDCKRSDTAHLPTTRTQQFRSTPNRISSGTTFPSELEKPDFVTEIQKTKKKHRKSRFRRRVGGHQGAGNT